MLKKAFTLVELMVAVTIVTILTAVSFYSYVGYVGDSRDVQRIADIGKITSALKTYKQKRGYYPNPGNTKTLTNSGEIVAYQGELNRDVRLDTLEDIPTDPLVDIEYPYSVTTNRQEMQVSGVIENGKDSLAILDGSYKSVSKNVLPTILLATDATGSIEIQDGIGTGSVNRLAFVYDGLRHNLPYTTKFPFSPLVDTTRTFDENLLEAESLGKFWQNNDLRSCLEIEEAGKAISGTGVSHEYQIVSSTGAISDVSCTF